jgi:hypothetical protein
VKGFNHLIAATLASDPVVEGGDHESSVEPGGGMGAIRLGRLLPALETMGLRVV